MSKDLSQYHNAPDAVLYRALIEHEGLEGFVKRAWHLVEPSKPLKWSWHMTEICKHLEAVSRVQIRKLVINVPPGASKSSLVQVFWPAWEWSLRPGTRFISASYDGNLTLRDSRLMLGILRSDWFKERWGSVCQLPADTAASDFVNLNGGQRFSTSVGGKMTGRHADVLIVDDPIKPQDVSKVTLDSCERWWKETVQTRFVDHATSRKVIIMQRLHENDLTAIALREQGWEHLRLPMYYEAGSKCITSIGRDPRETEGEVIDPVRFPEEAIQEMKETMGPRGVAAQLQQRPAPAEGAIFLQKWFKHYREPPARFDTMLQSWDCAFKDTDGSDYVCGQLWGVKGGEFFLVDQDWGHYDFPATCAAVERMTRKYPQAITKLIEDKANGTAVIQTLRKKISGIIEVQPEGGKEARANAVAPLFEAGNVWFPDPSLASWVDGYELEMMSFPFARNDDRVDATTQALLYMHGKHNNYAQAMANAKVIFGLQ